VNSNWKECKLGKVAEFKNGKSRPSEIENGTIPIYGGNGILGYTDTFNYQGETVIVGRVGAYCGSVFYENKPIWVSDNALYTIPKNKTDAKFLYYLLNNMSLNSQAEGSSHPLLTQTLLNSLDVFITDSLPEQRAIAGVLSSLDDKIDLLHRQNKTLEGMAEALWRKMFVEEADPGWKKGKLGDIADINPLRSIKNAKVALYIDMANMPTSGPFPKGWIQREFTSGIKFKNGDTIIARITPCLENGKTAYINFLDNEEIGWGSTEYIVLAPKTGCCSEWYYFLARNNDFRDFAILNMTGTSGRQRVSGDSIAQYEITIPPLKISEKFRIFAGPVMEHIKHNSFQIRTLSRLRDTLLPKLMSGVVRVGI